MTLNLITTRNNSHFRSCYFCCGSFRLHLFSRDHFWSDIHFHTYCFVAQQLFRSLVSRWCHYLYVKKKLEWFSGICLNTKNEKKTKIFSLKQGRRRGGLLFCQWHSTSITFQRTDCTWTKTGSFFFSEVSSGKARRV